MYHQRLLRSSDAPALHDFYRRNWRFFKPWFPAAAAKNQDLHHCEQQLQQQLAEIQAGTGVYFALFDNDKSRLIARCNLNQIARGPFNACYMGYAIDQDYQGQGLMFDFCGAVVAYAFDELKLHRIMANYMPHNNRSARLLKKLDFNVEGVARDYLEINGRYENHVLTSLTRKS